MSKNKPATTEQAVNQLIARVISKNYKTPLSYLSGKKRKAADLARRIKSGNIRIISISEYLEEQKQKETPP